MTRRRPASHLPATLLALSVLGLCSAAQAAEEKARPEIGKHLQEAQKDINAGNIRGGLAELQEADNIGNKRPVEIYYIEALREQAYIKLKDNAGAARAAEGLIASGNANVNVANQYQIIIEVNYAAKDYAKVIDATNKYYKAGGTDPKYRQIMVPQSYYLMGDWANASRSMKAAEQETIRAGGRPTEDQLQLILSSEFKQSTSSPAYTEALVQLLRYYPKKEYWHDALLAVRKTDGYSQKLDLDVDRMRIATGNGTEANIYTDAAESAIDAGLPGEAKQILDKGFAAKVLGQGSDAARHNKLSALANKEAADDQRTLAQNETVAKAAPGGDKLIALGDDYESYGQYDAAITAYKGGIAKGSLKYPDIAKLHLGIAYCDKGDKSNARQTFNSIKAADGTAQLGQLWAIQCGA